MLLQMVLFGLFFVLWWSNNPLYIHHIFLSRLFVYGHLGCFHVLAIVKSAAMNVGVHLFTLGFSFFLDTCPGVGLLDHIIVLFLVFLRKLHTLSP